MTEIVYDKRISERRDETLRAGERKIRKAIRDGEPGDKIAALIEAHIERLKDQRDNTIRALLRYRYKRNPTDAEMAEMTTQIEGLVDEVARRVRPTDK
jgi:hypothetical protein